MPRIAIGGFLHETNCFVPMRTDYAYYAKGGEFPPLARGEQILERTRGSSYGMSGFLEVMEGKHELVPLIWGHAGAGGYITDDAFERILERGRPTHRAFHKMPFLLPLNFQCTLVEPSKALVDFTVANEGGDIANLSYAAGFPPSDLSECGPSVVCHGWSEAEVNAKAQALADMVNEREPVFAEELLTPDEAVTRAMSIAAGASKPVVIADTQDNPGCGGTCDTTGMLEALVRHDAQGVAMCVMCDPDAASAAHAAGEGASIALDLGGKHDILGDKPFHGRFTVTRLSDGRFVTTGKSIPGRQIDIGPTALLGIGGISIVVASRRMQAFDQDIFKHIGVEPTAQRILVLKSTCHFRADFQPIAEQILIAVAPGAHVVDSTTYPFKHLRPGVRLAPMGPEFRGTVL